MSHIIWMEEGNLPTINRQVTWFLSESPLSTCIPDDFRPLLVERVSSIHYYMLIQAGSLEQTGPSLCQPSDMESTNSYCYLMEKMNILLTREGGKGVLPVPYVGPLSLRNFLECLCRMYRERSELVKKQENNLKYANTSFFLSSSSSSSLPLSLCIFFSLSFSHSACLLYLCTFSISHSFHWSSLIHYSLSFIVKLSVLWLVCRTQLKRCKQHSIY